MIYVFIILFRKQNFYKTFLFHKFDSKLIHILPSTMKLQYKDKNALKINLILSELLTKSLSNYHRGLPNQSSITNIYLHTNMVISLNIFY